MNGIVATRRINKQLPGVRIIGLAMHKDPNIQQAILNELVKGHTHNFYQMVIKKVGNADNIFIFGPGEAKLELAKEIKKIKGRHDRIAAVEVSDRLTENQIVTKIRSFFLAPEAGDLP